MKKFKKGISIILSFLLIFNLISIYDMDIFADNYAQKINSKTISMGNSENKVEVIEKDDGQIVNPLYEGSSVKTYSPKPTATPRATNVFSTKKAAADYMRSEMVKRSGTIKFTIKKSNYDDLYQDLFAMAMEDDENADSSEGDYLFRHWSSFYASWDESVSGQTTFTFYMEYLSTYKQEQEVNYEVKKVLDELDVYDEDEYTKTKAVHDFISENISYDYDLEKYSAYDGIISKNVVCNGYAALTYKMMKDLGVGVRCITGYSNGDYHAWNIGRIKDKWYNIDNTWDACDSYGNIVVYSYFLKNNAAFSNHDRDAEFTTSEFNASHPMSKTSYKEESYYIQAFTLNKLQKTIDVGESLELFAINLGDNDKIKSFTSSNENVATVDNNGLVIGKNIGQTTITCETENGYKATSRIKVRYDISDCKITQINNGEKLIYDGSVKKPSVTVTYKDKVLVESQDYSIDYGDNYLPGKGSLKIVGIGNYTGSKTATFKIYPAKVTGQKVLSTGTTYIKIRWNKEPGVTGYRIYRATSKDGTYSKIATVSSSHNTYTNSGLTSGKNYYYKVRAYKTVNDQKLFGYSSTVLNGKTKYPGQVKNLTQNSSYRTLIKLSWDKASYASGYRVYRSTTKDGTYKKIAELSGGSSTNYTDKDVSPGKTYYYKVRAYRKVGSDRDYGTYSDILKASTKCNTPVILAYSSSKGKVKISWKKVSGASGYAIYRSSSKNGDYTRVKTVSSGSTLSVTGSGLQSGKTYYYKVRAYRTADIGKVYSYASDVKSVKVK